MDVAVFWRVLPSCISIQKVFCTCITISVRHPPERAVVKILVTSESIGEYEAWSYFPLPTPSMVCSVDFFDIQLRVI